MFGLHARTAYGAIAALACVAALGSAQASVITFTDRGAFDATVAALSGVSTAVEGFESSTPGDLIGDGAALGGYTYLYGASGNNLAVSGISIAVTDGNQFGGGGPFATTSGSNFLGTSDGDVFQSGDDFSLGFAATRALGMYFISADTLLDGDITLSAAGATASLLVADLQSFGLADGSVYFLGVIDDTGSFSTASIRSACCGLFLFNIDDIVTARAQVQGVPEPGTLALLVSGLAGLASVARRRRSEVFSG